MIFWMIIFTAMVSTDTDAQGQYDSSMAIFAKQCPEAVVVFTDRSIYTVNEAIRFSALLSSRLESFPGGGSKILYVELISSEGEVVARGKFPVISARSAGSLSIPANFYTGVCYLRCYTRWMRNFGANSFAYLPLRVINPFTSTVQEPEITTAGNTLKGSSIGRKGVSLVLSRHSYNAGEVVHAELGIGSTGIEQVTYGCIAAVPWGAIDTSILHYRMDPDQVDQNPFRLELLPELDGMAISGVVRDPVTTLPVAHTRVYFSFLGTDPAFYIAQADEYGKFVMNTPLKIGSRELYVAGESGSGHPLDVLLDNDYVVDELPFRAELFTLQEEQYTLVTRLALQMQLEQAFLEREADDRPDFSETRIGDPVPWGDRISLKLDEFIQLPSLEEVIQNLIPKTYVTGREGNRIIVIKGENPMITMYPMLLLVDHLPVMDMEAFLSISPSKIERIDVVPEVLIKGDFRFGGMISIATRKGDFGGIQLPEGSYFFDLECLTEPLSSLHPRIDGQGSIPDTRNTLFWMDQVAFDTNDGFTFEFRASQTPGSYLVLFRGITSTGEWVYDWSRFDVK
jgi:hypothetical protein